MTILHLTARSYGDARAPERHPYAQFVLPVSGCLDLEIAGHGGRLAMGSAAFVAAGTDHAQAATSRNRFLILDMDMALVGDAAADMLARRRFLPLSPQARHLIDFMRLHLDGGARPAAVLAHWAPLLIDALTCDAPPFTPSRLAPLRDAMAADPGAPWTAAAMARMAGLSTSRLHAVFRRETGRTPQAWLSDLRLRQVQAWLADSDQPIAELALRAGFADQSALTRAFRRATGTTPAAYRRAHR